MTASVNYQDLPPYITNRIGPLLLVIGLISALQASGAFPLGASTYPEAFILLSVGGLLALGAFSKSSAIARLGQGLLAISAILLIVIF